MGCTVSECVFCARKQEIPDPSAALKPIGPTGISESYTLARKQSVSNGAGGPTGTLKSAVPMLHGLPSRQSVPFFTKIETL